MAGPPVIIYWLGRQNTAAVVRANLLVFFMLISIVILAVYLSQGLLTPEALALAVLLGLPFVVAMTAGAWWFRGASEGAYRRVACTIMAVAALLSVPVLARSALPRERECCCGPCQDRLWLPQPNRFERRRI